jgi:hypothetical protein
MVVQCPGCSWNIEDFNVMVPLGHSGFDVQVLLRH